MTAPVLGSLKESSDMKGFLSLKIEPFRIYGHLDRKKDKLFLCQYHTESASPNYGNQFTFVSYIDLQSKDDIFNKYGQLLWIREEDIVLLNKINKLYSYTLNKEGFLF